MTLDFRADPQGCEDWTPTELAEEVNETYCGKNRWSGLGWAFLGLAIIPFSLLPLFFSAPLSVILSLFVFGIGTSCLLHGVLTWRDWLRRRHRLALLKRIVRKKAIARSKSDHEESHEHRQRDAVLQWRRHRNRWLLGGVVGVAGMVLLGLDYWVLGPLPLVRQVIGVALLWSIWWWDECRTQTWRWAAIVQNLRRGERGAAVMDALLVCGYPYALYLRSFATEAHSADALGCPSWGFPPEHTISRNEAALLREFAGAIPVFAMTNDRDFGHEPTAMRLWAAGENWQNEFKELAASAEILIVALDHMSDGLRAELKWIETTGALGRAVIVTPPGLSRVLPTSDANLISSARWLLTTNRTDLPHDLRDRLAALKAAQHGLRCDPTTKMSARKVCKSAGASWPAASTSAASGCSTPTGSSPARIAENSPLGYRRGTTGRVNGRFREFHQWRGPRGSFSRRGATSWSTTVARRGDRFRVLKWDQRLSHPDSSLPHRRAPRSSRSRRSTLGRARRASPRPPSHSRTTLRSDRSQPCPPAAGRRASRSGSRWAR